MRVRTFFRKSRTLFKRRSYNSLITDTLSPELQDDVRYAITFHGVFDCVDFLRDLDHEFLEVETGIVRYDCCSATGE